MTYDTKRFAETQAQNELIIKALADKPDHLYGLVARTGLTFKECDKAINRLRTAHRVESLRIVWVGSIKLGIYAVSIKPPSFDQTTANLLHKVMHQWTGNRTASTRSRRARGLSQSYSSTVHLIT